MFTDMAHGLRQKGKAGRVDSNVNNLMYIISNMQHYFPIKVECIYGRPMENMRQWISLRCWSGMTLANSGLCEDVITQKMKWIGCVVR